TLAFKAPRSYTGEDVVEFQCHGGTLAPRRVLEGCLAAGARLARRGEFTERAFLNGKLTYEAAQSVLDLVDAKTDRAADAALRGLDGAGRRELKEFYSQLVELSSTLEHALDVSEEELPDGFLHDVDAAVDALAGRLEAAVRRAREGRILRDGALVVIAGPPNAGKSSLLNALLGERRAIVSDEPGTTRDSIEEWLDIDGWPVRIVDTAGLREADDEIEREGVSRARALVGKADIILRLVPADAPPPALAPDERAIDVLSKCDLPQSCGGMPASLLSVSAKTGAGLNELRGAIVAALRRKAAAPDEAQTTLDGCEATLSETLAIVRGAGRGVSDTDDLVVRANRLRAAAECVGEAIGAVYSSDVLDALFSRFCVGK
ncbi:MAG: tRNA uridine-5-carboxymethylaminomethyl(34) synthesis GTPase MnmE, partial [Kiritimatiellae bacterium]|nr:tRNA uridine-5-carboxymethylaminomethyl(34) synthesis GTPase MnmE [Kiritimatiellia bacterium]